ncbi:MAG: hypothetical protein ACW99H_10345 [Candidatus Thorarchaeota archaeon]
MEKPVFPINLEDSLPVTFLEGTTSRATPVPTLYAIRFLCGELESALDTLLQSHELQELLSQREEEKNEIHECLLRVMHRFQEFLMIDVRR